MPEINELEADWNAGKLECLVRDLGQFIIANRREILEYKQRALGKLRKVPLSDDLAIRMYILQIRSISPQGEIRDQLVEIEREIWIRGEHTDGTVDRQQVAREWCQRHAPGWRDHRVMAIVYVFEKKKDDFVRLLRGESGKAS